VSLTKYGQEAAVFALQHSIDSDVAALCQHCAIQPPLMQGTLGIEEKLRIVQSSVIPFVNADRDNDFRLPASFADCVGGS
jgi:hypothetical protein